MLRRSLGILVVLVLSAAVGCTTTAPSISDLTGLPPLIIIPGTAVLTISGSPGSSSGLFTWTFSTNCGGTFTSTTTPNNGPANPITIGPTSATTVQVTYDSTGATPGPCTFTVKLVTASGRSATLQVTTAINIVRTLTVTKAGTGTGTVTSSPPGINCGSVCVAGFDNGTVVTLTAVPDAGSKFDGWSGDSDCSDGQVTMDADKTCTATFTLLTADLSLTKADAPDPVTYGSNVTYTLTVINNGPDPATNVTLTDTLPTNVAFVSATPSQGSCSGTTTITCNLGTINNGANATVTIVVQAKATGIDLIVDDDTGTCAYTAATDTASVTATEPDPVPGDNTATAGTTISANYNTISAAIAAASAGQKIFVCPGTYNESVTINKSLTLKGAQADIDPRPAVGGRTGPESVLVSSATAIDIKANNVEINGFKIGSSINNASLNIVQETDVSLVSDGVRVLYNIIYNTGYPTSTMNEAVKIRTGTNALIAYNYIYNIPAPGDGINFDAVTNGTIAHNELRNQGSENAAIYVYGSTGTQVINNLVYDVTQNDGIKLGAKNGADASKRGGLIKDNIVHHTKQDGIAVYMSEVTVEGNEVYQSTSENGAIYVAFAVSDITIQNNIVRNNTLNTLKWGNPGAIMIGTAVNVATVRVNNNNIYSNTPNGVTNKASGVLNATNNWWGHASGPYDPTGTNEVPPCTADPTTELNADGTGDKVSDNVDYCPWATAPF